MKGIIQPARGRPSKVTKPTATPRGRPVRRGGGSETLPNQDPDLEPHEVGIEEEQEQEQAQEQQQHHQNQQQQQQQPQQQQQQHHHHDHHADFDPEAAAAAAAAAAAHHQHHQQQQLDLTAASILASSVQSPHEQHPDLTGAPHVEGGEAGPHTTESFAQQSGYNNVVVESALAKRLAREPGMRLAQQRRPEQSLNLARRSNVEALFAHIAGELAPVPCKNCHKGHGPWNSCVIVDGQMCGSCANCWFNASGARCSFHETRNPQAHGGSVMAGDGIGFQMPPAPPNAMAPFNFASIPASADPVVRYTVEQAMAQVRGADKKTRHMLMVEAAARQLAFQIVQYEDAVQEEQNQQGPPQAVMNEPDAAP